MDAKQHKYGVQIKKSTQLERNLELFRRHFIEANKPAWLVVPYILLCAAFLESLLNDSLHNTSDHFGPELSNSLLSLSLPTKLKILVPAMTDGKYEINKNHFVYQRLVVLIRIRNELAHAKPELIELKKDEYLTGDSFIYNKNPKIPPRAIFDEDITLDATKDFSPLEIHEALDKLEKWFFRRCPDRLGKVEMVTKRDPSKEWQKKTVIMTKYLD